MKIINDHRYIPFGPYLAEMEVDPEFCRRLLEVGKTLTKKYTAHLAGELEHEYIYDLEKHPWIEEEFKVCVNTWLSGFRQFTGDPNFDAQSKLSHLWINFQKAGEYNPIHLHPGCELSFVLYLEVPEEMLKEKKTSRGIPAGYTAFLYGEHADLHVVNRVVKPKEGTLVMFPSNLKHHASHFNSKVTRTSVSGNIKFTHTKESMKTKGVPE